MGFLQSLITYRDNNKVQLSSLLLTNITNVNSLCKEFSLAC